jgi:hypothetical protein
VEIDAKLMQWAVGAGKVFVNEMRATDIFAVDAVFPIAEEMIGWVPKLVLLSAAKPGESPVDHFGAAARHASERRHQHFSAGQVLVAGLERQVAWVQ